MPDANAYEVKLEAFSSLLISTSVNDSPSVGKTRVTTATGHNLAAGDQISIAGASAISGGTYSVDASVSPTVFDIATTTLTPGVGGTITKLTCLGTADETQRGNTVSVSNPSGTIVLEPEPNSVTVAAADEVKCIRATVRNSRGDLLSDGAQVTFSFASSSGKFNMIGTQSVTPSPSALGGTSGSVTSIIGTSYTTPALVPSDGRCTAASGSGQAVARLEVNEAALTVITVTATSGTASGTTRVNDPPDPPFDLELDPGSIKVRFKPSTRPTVAGYFVLLGTESGKYSRQIDIKKATTAHIEDGIVGGRQ